MATGQPKSAASAVSGSSTTGNGSKTVPELESDIEKLREDIALLTKHLKETGDHTMKGAKRAASEQAEQLRAQGEAAIDTAREKAGDMEDELVARVREKPITSLALAAGVGFLFAVIMRR